MYSNVSRKDHNSRTVIKDLALDENSIRYHTARKTAIVV